jgi:hypothetical protein
MADRDIETSGDPVPGSADNSSSPRVVRPDNYWISQPLVLGGSAGTSASPYELSPIPPMVTRGQTVLSQGEYEAVELQVGQERKLRAEARVLKERQEQQLLNKYAEEQREHERREHERSALVERIRKDQEIRRSEEQQAQHFEDEHLQSLSPDSARLQALSNETGARRLSVEDQLAEHQRAIAEATTAIFGLISQLKSPTLADGPAPAVPARSVPRTTSLSFATAQSGTPTKSNYPAPNLGNTLAQVPSFEFVPKVPRSFDRVEEMVLRRSDWQARRDSEAPQPVPPPGPPRVYQHSGGHTNLSQSPEGPFAVPALSMQENQAAVPTPGIPAHIREVVSQHPSDPTLVIDGGVLRKKFSTPLSNKDKLTTPDKARLPGQPGTVLFAKAKEEAFNFQVKNGSNIALFPIIELQVLYEMASHSDRTRDFISGHIYQIMDLCVSPLIRSALLHCVIDDMFHWTTFTKCLMSPPTFEHSTSYWPSARPAGNTKGLDLYSDLSEAEKDVLRPFNLHDQTFGEMAPGTLISALFAIASQVLGGPTQAELTSFNAGMIVIGDPDHVWPFSPVPSDEGPLGVFKRTLYIYHMFLNGPDRSWVKEELTSMGHTLTGTFSRAITVPGREWLSKAFVKLLQEGPSSKRATETERIGLLIARLQAIFDNSNSTVMQSLHLGSSHTPQAVPAMAYVHQTATAASTLPADHRLTWPLNVKPTHAGAPQPAPMLYPPTMNVKGQTRPPSQSLPSSPPAPRPAPRPRVCFLCQSPDHWGDQCPDKGSAIEAVQAKKSRQQAALSTILDDASAFAVDYAYMSREEQEEWENGHHENDEYDEQGFALPP